MGNMEVDHSFYHQLPLTLVAPSLRYPSSFCSGVFTRGIITVYDTSRLYCSTYSFSRRNLWRTDRLQRRFLLKYAVQKYMPSRSVRWRNKHPTTVRYIPFCWWGGNYHVYDTKLLFCHRFVFYNGLPSQDPRCSICWNIITSTDVLCTLIQCISFHCTLSVFVNSLQVESSTTYL